MGRAAEARARVLAEDHGMTSLAIETHGLGKRFGTRAALESIDLEVPLGCAFVNNRPEVDQGREGAGQRTRAACGQPAQPGGRALREAVVDLSAPDELSVEDLAVPQPDGAAARSARDAGCLGR